MIFAKCLLKWYDANKRDLPWRGTKDPYKIWLSEVMLQQTTVKAVEPRWRRFLERWPTLADLSRAPLEDVLHEWTGLGYYARARNLHKAATQAGNALPQTYHELLKLPGLGVYTAAAVASIAFGERVPLVDANVERVLARVYTIEDDIRSTAARKALRAHAESLIPADRPGDFNQALMELGATVCTPRHPRCTACPIAKHCGAFQLGRQMEYPKLSTRVGLKEITEIAAVIHNRDGKILLLLRKESGSFANMWEVPRVVLAEGESEFDAAVRAARELAGIAIKNPLEILRIKHTIMRNKIALRIFESKASKKAADVAHPIHAEARWVTFEEWEALPKSITQARLLKFLRTRECS